MSKVVDYQIVRGFDPILRQFTEEALANSVRHLMLEGWQPLGGVAVTTTQPGQYSVGETVLIQAMVKYE
jgi:hypothetical protein